MKRKQRTTIEAAAAAGVPRATVQHWIKTGKIQAPPVELVRGRFGARLWSDAKIRELRRLKATLKPGPKKKREVS